MCVHYVTCVLHINAFICKCCVCVCVRGWIDESVPACGWVGVCVCDTFICK